MNRAHATKIIKDKQTESKTRDQNPVSLKLRAGTAGPHAEAEKISRLQRALATDYTLAEYLELLDLLYAFHSGLERRLCEEPCPSLLKVFQARCRSRDIFADLAAFGAAPSDGLFDSVQETLPVLGSGDERFGAAYVLEGSSLGGALIAKALRGSLGPKIAERLCFHGGDARHLASGWRSFLALLDEKAVDGDRAVAAACATFEAITVWLRA
jgi:heme oxygenase